MDAALNTPYHPLETRHPFFFLSAVCFILLAATTKFVFNCTNNTSRVLNA